MDVKIEAINPILVNKEKDQWAVAVVFKCNNCGGRYEITKNNEKELDIFMESLRDGLPSEYIGCKKCDKITIN